jgi:hypothetical protein
VAGRLRERRLYKTLDLRIFGEDDGRQRQRERMIDEAFKAKLIAGSVVRDGGAGISIYTQIGGDDDRMHKKLHILNAGQPEEISRVSELVRALTQRKPFTRYYFESESDRDQAKRLKRGVS